MTVQDDGDSQAAEPYHSENSINPYVKFDPKLPEAEHLIGGGTIERSYEEDMSVSGTLPLEVPATASEEPSVRVYELQDGDAIIEVRENTGTTHNSLLENPLNNY
mmetsp:Transcript_6739/g.9209  ORF Transcript_6739/g.9209 Transcript_6739/m.9209 type:complete len:105 (+) Transcript_6739:506-820(+)|eukprot:CAMPEP_0170478440 /NCGR_PEP_ID=MMETSP0123-20130129/19453_1 /TAXON_ID=182087 /ORGANISM="Favella ehrenbergii, Strain Fehren 1" /LENGTH=104 /DNA_ID=CAMNT_0010750677 /DNA_START=166 /DNA_END=480 /DNA_ORIENTATION=-